MRDRLGGGLQGGRCAPLAYFQFLEISSRPSASQGNAGSDRIASNSADAVWQVLKIEASLLYSALIRFRQTQLINLAIQPKLDRLKQDIQ